MNDRYVEFNNMIYPSSWFKMLIRLSDMDCDEVLDYQRIYDWATENKIPFIRDADHDDKLYFMNEEDVMAFKLRWV